MNLIVKMIIEPIDHLLPSPSYPPDHSLPCHPFDLSFLHLHPFLLRPLLGSTCRQGSFMHPLEVIIFVRGSSLLGILYFHLRPCVTVGAS